MGELTAEILKRQLLAHMIKQTEDGHMLSAARAALLLCTKASLLLESEILSLQREGSHTISSIKEPIGKHGDTPHLNWRAKPAQSMRERHTSGTGIGITSTRISDKEVSSVSLGHVRDRVASEEPHEEGRTNRAASIVESPPMMLKKEISTTSSKQSNESDIQDRMEKLANQVNQKRRASLVGMDIPAKKVEEDYSESDDEEGGGDWEKSHDLSPPVKLPPNVQSWSRNSHSSSHQNLDTTIAQIRRASLNGQIRRNSIAKKQGGSIKSISLDDYPDSKDEDGGGGGGGGGSSNITKNRRLSNAALSLLHAFNEDQQAKVGGSGDAAEKSEYTHRGKNSDSNYTTGEGYQLNVVIRKRPPSEAETDCVECSEREVTLYEDKVKVDLTKYTQAHKFKFDHAYSEKETTGDVYEKSMSELIDNLFHGGTSTAFCFGQTASGKTFTLFGAGGGQVDQSDMESGGVYMLAAQDIFNRLQQRRDVYLCVSMFEIYGQKVRDLLNENKELAALEDSHGVLQLVGLKEEECTNIDEFISISNTGRHARSTTATGANNTSSRSHAAMLFRLYLENDDETKKKCVGKFSLIDLAGSERGADNEATDKKTQMEGRQINTSLLALKEVIRAKELGRKHAPFRQSRLTQVLEESLTGNQCHTTVMGCISPCIKDTQQTLNTLRYAASLQGKKRPTLSGVATSVLAMNKLQKGSGGGATPTRRPPPVSPRGSKLHTSNPLHGARVPSPRSASQSNSQSKPSMMRKAKSMYNVKDDMSAYKTETSNRRQSTLEAGSAANSQHHEHVMRGHTMRRQSLSTRDDLSLLLDPLGLEQFREQLRTAAHGASAKHVKELGVVKFVNLGIPKIRALKLQKKAEELLENSR